MNNISEEITRVTISEVQSWTNERSKIIEWLIENGEGQYAASEEEHQISNSDYDYFSISFERSENTWKIVDFSSVNNTWISALCKFFLDENKFNEIYDKDILKLMDLTYCTAIIMLKEKNHTNFTPVTRFLLKQIENKDKKIDAMMDVMGNTI